MTWQLSQMQWLASPPADFRQVCKKLEADGCSGIAVQSLANHRLTSTQLFQLAKAIRGLDERGCDLRPLTRLRLGFLSNATTELLAPAFVATAARHGILLEVVETPFDQVAQEALTPGSSLHRAEPDVVLLALDYRALPLRPSPGDADQADATITAALDHVTLLCSGIYSNGGATVIVQTLASPPAGPFGNLDPQLPGTLNGVIGEFNRRLVTDFKDSGNIVFDVADLAAAVGRDHWHDPTQWNLGKFPFAQDLVPLYSDYMARLLGAIRGKSRKCLVLDLDNTLWGGVIGDDGLAGIVLGKGNPTGEAFLEVQRTALALRERGIVLAVSSKNDDAVAREVFRSHPEMLMKEDHIAVFQANWQDKASNLRAIAETLNIGVESLVLLDDNPAEREQVRQALPHVAVPELPEDPAFFSRALLAAGYFETVAFAAEDRVRAEQYQTNARRTELAANATDLGSYLRSLEMTATFAPFDAIGRSRITQLINKTNQFNLTTRRFTEREVELLEQDPEVFTLQVRLEDRFGDNGMISVVIASHSSPDWLISTWLMSCRVLNRQVERAILNHIVAEAQRRGVGSLIGRYVPSGRNGMVSEHYPKLGFAFLRAEGDTMVWRLDVADYVPQPVVLEVVGKA